MGVLFEQEETLNKGGNHHMDAYVMLSFTDFQAKAAFMERFGYSPYEKIIKGEVFDEQVERV